ncbi:hypothetical protein BKA83DRAFT_4330130 [Pisolithus microcarpus]|nr:hypothetical protein BKA83DRAFT_4330130 [Pisolithus microcarpus]
MPVFSLLRVEVWLWRHGAVADRSQPFDNGLAHSGEDASMIRTTSGSPCEHVQSSPRITHFQRTAGSLRAMVV